MDSDEDLNAGYLAPDSDDEPPLREDWAAEKAIIDRQERQTTRQLSRIMAKSGGSREETKRLIHKLHTRGTAAAATAAATADDDDDRDDPFGSEMDKELQERFNAVQRASGTAPTQPVQRAADVGVVLGEHYEDEYFDSSEDEDSRKKTRKKLTNDELLYDPSMDDDDDAWVQRQRASYRGAFLRCSQAPVACSK